ncbi:MAG TPA: hypothetical protein IAB62_09625 [Candidatus Coprocola pullicola]|nr:hypothetical protein [Candidatus Coprocola pullicola]
MKKQRLLLNKGEIAVCALKALAKTDEQVAEETGYTKKYCTQLQREERIQKKIKQLQTQKQMPQEDEILEFLMSVMKGKAYEEKNDSIMKDRMKAAELLVKRKQMMEQTEKENDVVIIVDDILGKQG